MDGARGYFCCLGVSEERALYGAIIDAVVGSGHPRAETIRGELDREGERIEAQWPAQSAAVAATRVGFGVR